MTDYKRPLIYAILLHIILLTILSLHRNSPPKPSLQQSQVDVINAVAMTSPQNESEKNTTEDKPILKNPELEKPSISKPIANPQENLSQMQDAALKIKRDNTKKIKEEAEKKLAEAEVLKKKQEAEKKLAESEALKKKEEEKKLAEAESLKKQKAEQAEKQKEANKKLAEKKAAALAEKKKKAAEAAAEQKRRAAELAAAEEKRKALESEKAEAAREASLQKEVDKYSALIISAIQRRWILPEDLDKNLTAELIVHLAPGGVVLTVDVVKSSGNPLLDNSAKAAVLKASPLPVPSDSNLFDKFRNIRLTVRPEGVLSAG